MKLLCRLFGHRWDYRFTIYDGVRFDQCSRCAALVDVTTKETP